MPALSRHAATNIIRLHVNKGQVHDVPQQKSSFQQMQRHSDLFMSAPWEVSSLYGEHGTSLTRRG